MVSPVSFRDMSLSGLIGAHQGRMCPICRSGLTFWNIPHSWHIATANGVTHVFHRTCIKQWWVYQRSCPECAVVAVELSRGNFLQGGLVSVRNFLAATFNAPRVDERSQI